MSPVFKHGSLTGPEYAVSKTGQRSTSPRPVVNPPRAPAEDGIMVVFGPRDPHDDPNLPANHVFTHKCVLPLTPQSLSRTSGATWTDGIMPVRGVGDGAQGGAPGWAEERAQYQGGQLENISFSARLEPPAFYISNTRTHTLADVQAGEWNPAALDTVRDGDGVLRIVEAGQVGGPVDVNAQLPLEKRYFNQYYATPPTLLGGTDVIMSDGAISPPGYAWFEPHILDSMLADACRSGEIMRLIMGDQYGFNRMVSIRSYVSRIEDSDPDVISFDITIREHRPEPQPSNPTVKHSAKQPPKSYTTSDRDTLHKIAGEQYGDASRYADIVHLNARALEQLWVYDWGPATSPSFFPANQSAGPRILNAHGYKITTIRKLTDFLGPDAYLRNGIRLTLRAPH